MKIYFWGFLFLFLLLTNCGNKKVALPLPLEEVADIIIDVHSAEAALQSVYGRRKDSLAQVYYHQIYEIYEIDSLEFKALMLTLRNHPDLMQSVYKRAMEKVEKRNNSDK